MISADYKLHRCRLVFFLGGKVGPVIQSVSGRGWLANKRVHSGLGGRSVSAVQVGVGVAARETSASCEVARAVVAQQVHLLDHCLELRRDAREHVRQLNETNRNHIMVGPIAFVRYERSEILLCGEDVHLGRENRCVVPCRTRCRTVMPYLRYGSTARCHK